jgi:hypothetical protein
MVKQGMIQPLTAYHGTPHTIQGQFDINKVGTGEGAQAYGHGMYFAENPAVATQYKSSTIPENALTDPQKNVVEWAKYEAGDEGPLAHLLDMQQLYTKKYGKENVDKAVEFFKGGNLYKVDIPDADIPNMLNWDEKVPEDLRKRISAKTMEQFGNGATGTSGEHLYKEIVFEMRRNGSKNPEADASKWLSEQGITGIRYLDEGSRSIPYAVAISTKKGPYAESNFATKEQAEQYIKEKQAEGFKTELKDIGTSNFVVFDPKTVKILEQNSKPVTRKELIQEQIDKIE